MIVHGAVGHPGAVADPVTGGWDADEALEQVYAAHWRSLVRLSMLLVGDLGTAEEVVQDAFVADCERVTKLLAQSLQAHDGSISAEHGIGLVKRPYLSCTRGAAEIAAMRGIKAVLDPNGIMNPGKLFDR